MPTHDAVSMAYVAAQTLATAGVRQLAAFELDDEDVHSVCVVVHRDGSADFSLMNSQGFPIGGGSL
jgi:hypothetical protein